LIAVRDYHNAAEPYNTRIRVTLAPTHLFCESSRPQNYQPVRACHGSYSLCSPDQYDVLDMALPRYMRSLQSQGQPTHQWC